MATDASYPPLDAQMNHSYAPSFNQLPPEVLGVLPSNPLLALELAYKISCHAYSQQVSRLEAEAQQLQGTLSQNQQVIKSLERRVASMEADMHEHQQRASQSLAEQHKLTAEKSALIETVKRLNREVAKLEHFKKNLLQQLQDDSDADGSGLLPSLAAVDLTTERLVSQVLHSADAIAAAGQQQQQHAAAGMLGAAAAGQQQLQPGQLHVPGVAAAGQQQQQHGLSPSKGLAGSLKQMPGGISAAGSPSSSGAYIAANSSKAPPSPPAAPGGLISAAQQQQQQQGGFGAGGGASSAARFGSPAAAARAAAGRAVVGSAGGVGGSGGGGGAFASEGGGGGARTSPRLDGKEFFRQARARLSYEQFSQFLVAIKELNAGRASRDDTLATARGLFGAHNADLYGLFEGLIMRHLTAL